MIKEMPKNPNYELLAEEIIKVRDAIKGSAFVKAKRKTYLADPSEAAGQIDKLLGKKRYAKYLEGAQFPEFTKQTLRHMVGRLNLSDAEVGLPDGVAYLAQDVDKDGSTINDLLVSIARNVLPVKWHLCIADYQGLTDLDTDALTAADIEAIRPRATIKQYARENVVDWDFRRINGAMQLCYVSLREIASALNVDAMERSEVESYVVLALDQDGFYYQQKWVKVKDSQGNEGFESGERNYPIVGGERLTWIPAYIFSDEPINAGDMPLELGMLATLSDIAYNIYRVSADQKTAMRYLPPTTYILGMDSADLDVFEAANGRKYIETGAGCVNIIPGQGDVKIIGADTQMQFYADYIKEQQKEVRALGGVWQTDGQTDKTALEVATNNAEQMSVLAGVAASIESGIKKLIAYCAMFEGLVAPDSVEDYAENMIAVNMKTDLGAVKLTPDEVRVSIELYREGVYDLEELTDVLSQGGWTVTEAAALVSRMRNSGEAP